MLDTSHFPSGKYTPHGYLDNPYHSAVMNPSGVIRSVPPIGFGFWCRQMPFPYGDGFGHQRIPNYLSLIHLSLNIEGTILHTIEDFAHNHIELYSAYHTKLIKSYDFEYLELVFSAKYMLLGENSIVCMLEVQNRSKNDKIITLHATNVHGFPGLEYWGKLLL